MPLVFRKVALFFCVTILISNTLGAQWPSVAQSMKPWTRWWWMGNAVDEKNINRSLQQYDNVGFGGVEIVPIYGAKGYEDRYIRYLSPQWMQMLDYTVKKSNALNMGVFVSVGTGWPIGGPTVSQEDAASKVIVQKYELNAHTPLVERIEVKDPKQKGVAVLSALMGYDSNRNAVDLTRMVDSTGKLDYQPSKNMELYAVFTGKTRQMVKRAAPGGEGYTLDHFSKDATYNYFKAFDSAFGSSSHGVKGFFNDSYEVYNANWTPAFFEEFRKRRGYDLRNHLPAFFSDENSSSVARLKSDYRETVSDLMRENFATVFTNWTHKRNALSINQAHGSPGNLLYLYSAFDIPETETFGSTYFPIKGLKRDSANTRNVDPDPNMLKFASSAAHVYGKPFTSSETFTWLTEHFKTSWSQCKPEVDQVFLSGINHVFYHGTTYSPQDVPWPGWLFYASVNFVPDNSLWPHLIGLNQYITRCQSILQSGKVDNELAVYWPVYDAWNHATGMDMPLSVHSIEKWLHPTPFYKNIVALQNNGYSLDYVSDHMISQTTVQKGAMSATAKGAEYKALIVPKCERMPVNTLKNILRIAGEGGTVILEQIPQDVPGYYEVNKRKTVLKQLVEGLPFSSEMGLKIANIGKGRIVVGNINNALNFLKLAPEPLVTTGLKFIRRKTVDAVYYFIVNHTEKDIDEHLGLTAQGKSVLLMDPLNGGTGKIPFNREGGKTKVRLQLKSGQSIIVKVSARVEEAPLYQYPEAMGAPILLSNKKWTINFKNGGPVLPSEKQIDSIVPWTSFVNDPNTQSFSGTGVYSTNFRLKNKAKDYLLKLDKIYESARVYINGKDAGLIWSLPFEMRAGKHLKEGENTIRIEVCNLMANRIRYMDLKKEVWRNYQEINFVNINYKEFNAAAWEVQPSGLEGMVQLIPLK